MATWQILHTGDIVGLNEYKRNHGAKLSKMINPIKWQLNPKIAKQKIPRLPYFELRVTHNTKFDLDNITGTIKVFVDLLRFHEIIKDDTSRHWDYMSIAYDPMLPKRSILFTIQSTNYETTNSKTNTGLQKPKRNPKGI
jgi:hypothetical protein